MTLKTFNDHICDLYKASQTLLKQVTFPLFSSDKYANLLFIHHLDDYTREKYINKTAETTLGGGISSTEIDRSYTIDNTEEIFDLYDRNVTSNKNILLIEGVPGIGKTMLCKEIAYRWACKELISSDKLVLLLFLRDPSTQNINCIEDLVCYFHKSNIQCNEIYKISSMLQATKGTNITVILDGYDEIPYVKREAKFFQQLLSKNILPYCRIVITTRPTATNMDMLRRMARVNVEILGFTSKNRKVFIKNEFKDNTDKLNKLTEYLDKNKIIDQLCYIPFMLSVLVFITKVSDELPKSRTEVYSKFIIYTISRFLQSDKFLPDTIPEVTIVQINDLSPEYKTYFLGICRYAYNALQENKIVFTANEIRTDFPTLADAPSNWSGLGLLKTAQYFSAKEDNNCTSYNFLHLSIQEYLAAYHITTLSINRQLSVIKNYFFDKKYLNMWIMYSGLCEQPLALKHFLSGNRFLLTSRFFEVQKISTSILQSKIKCLYLFQCLLEFKDPNLYNQVSSIFAKGELDLSDHCLSQKDIDMLTSILVKLTITQWNLLNLSNCKIDDAKCHQMVENLGNINHPIKFRNIDLSRNLLTGASLQAIAGIPIYCHAKWLHLPDNSVIYNTAALDLATEYAFKEEVKMLSLCIQINDQMNIVFKNLNQENIISQLNATYWITAVYLINCKIDEMVTGTLNLVSNSLNKLCIWNCRIPENDMFNLLFIMREENKRKVFCLYSKSRLENNNFVIIYNVLSDRSFFSLMFILLNDVSVILHMVNDVHINYAIISSPKLSETNKLTEIQMFKCNVSDEASTSLCEFIRQCTKIVKIMLVDNNFELGLLIKIINAIKEYCSLIEIHIRDNLTEGDCCVIADELCCNKIPYIQSLVMFTNKHPRYFKCFRSCNKQLSEIHRHKAIRLQPLEDPLNNTSISYTLIYEKITFNINKNLDTFLSTPHILLCESRLVLTRINSYLTAHMVLISKSLEPTCLTEIQLEYCIITDSEVAKKLLEKIIKNCQKLTTFLYSDNHVTIDSRTLQIFACNLISLPWIKTLYINDTILQNSDISAIKEKLYNYPKLEAIIRNDNLVMRNGGSADELMYSQTLSNKTIWFQYCKINLNKIIHSDYKCVEIKYSVIYDETMQFCDDVTSLELLDVSHNHITKSAMKTLVSIISNSNAIKELYLIDNRIRRTIINEEVYKNFNMLEIANDLATAISTKDDLQILVLNEIYLTSTIEIVAKALRKASGLKKLDFNGTIGKNEALPSEIKGIVAKNYSLQSLHLKDLNLKVKGTIDIARALCDISGIEILDLQNNNITERAAETLASVISNNTGLEELYLGNNHLEKGIITISVALKKILSLKTLDLENNKMSEKVVTELAAAITANKSLQNLWLDNNYKLGSSMKIISMACSKISSLQQLCLTNTGMSERGGDDIASIIYNNHTIIRLSISDNNLQSSGFILMFNALKNIKTLRYFHASGVSITARITKQLKEVIDNNQLLEEFSLSDNSLESGLIEIAESCSKLTGLKLLELSHTSINSTQVVNLASVISKSNSLESLSLGGITLSAIKNLYVNIFNKKACTFMQVNNNSGKVIEFACYELLKMKTIRDFLLNYDWIYLSYSYEYVHISYLYEDIFHKLSKNKAEYKTVLQGTKKKLSQIDSKGMISSLQIIRTLKVINLENNNIDEAAATELAGHLHCNNILEQLWMRGNELYDKGASVVLQSLHNLSTLLILDLSYNHLSSESADGIAVVVGNNCSLQQLWLDGNELLTRGVVRIASALKKLSSLRILSLCSNGITDDAAEEISNVITNNTLLVDLLLGNNQLQPTGICKIAITLRKVLMLRKLNLSNSRITPDAAKELAVTLSNCTNLQQAFFSDSMLGTEGTIKIANALKCINTLQVLTLSNNNITESAADVLVGVLKNNISLKIVLISKNELQTTGITHIVQAVKNISRLQLLDVSDNKVSEYKRRLFKNNNFIIIV